MDGSRFDELTRRLATGSISRRGLLRGLGGSLAGAGLTAALGRPALAAKGGNSACAQWCHANFSGSDAGHCTADATHGTGMCYQCGPKGSGDQQLCGTTCIATDGCCTSADCPSGQCLTCDSTHTCVSTCSADQHCDGAGNCVADDWCAGITCPTCQTCAGGTCVTDGGQNGMTCPGGDACLQTYTCQDGTCTGSNPVTCAECQTCAGGSCVAANEGGRCAGGTCSNGTCVASDPCAGVTCPECQTCSGGTCVAANEGGDCTGGTCQNGTCQCNGNPACGSCQVCLQGAGCATLCTTGSCGTCPGSEFCDTSTGFCVVPQHGGGCFVAGTRVAMADGTSKPIDLVAVGDVVLGQGRANRVLSVLHPTLGARPLYALNGGIPFVTAGHPFRTEDGWKAVDPVATAAEVPGLVVGRLTVGDRLLALAGVAVPADIAGGGDLEVLLETMPLHSLTAHVAVPATPLFNLHVDGDHTFVANDLLVHNKIFARPALDHLTIDGHGQPHGVEPTGRGGTPPRGILSIFGRGRSRSRT